jgi:hypothetical protein
LRNKELGSEFDALGQSIEKRIEELFITATLQSLDDISLLRDKLGATTEQINKLNTVDLSVNGQDVKGEELSSDDLAED